MDITKPFLESFTIRCSACGSDRIKVLELEDSVSFMCVPCAVVFRITPGIEDGNPDEDDPGN